MRPTTIENSLGPKFLSAFPQSPLYCSAPLLAPFEPLEQRGSVRPYSWDSLGGLWSFATCTSRTDLDLYAVPRRACHTGRVPQSSNVRNISRWRKLSRLATLGACVFLFWWLDCSSTTQAYHEQNGQIMYRTWNGVRYIWAGFTVRSVVDCRTRWICEQ